MPPQQSASSTPSIPAAPRGGATATTSWASSTPHEGTPRDYSVPWPIRQKFDPTIGFHNSAAATAGETTSSGNALKAAFSPDALWAACDVLQAQCDRATRVKLGHAGVPVPPSLHGLGIPDGEKVTSFHSLRVPGVTLRDLARSTMERCGIEREAMLAAVVLSHRVLESPIVPPSAHVVHRLYLAAVYMVVRILRDSVFSPESWARATALSRREVVRAERQLLLACDWHIIVSARDVELLLLRNAAAARREAEEKQLADEMRQQLLCGPLSDSPSTVAPSDGRSLASNSRFGNSTDDEDGGPAVASSVGSLSESSPTAPSHTGAQQRVQHQRPEPQVPAPRSAAAPPAYHPRHHHSASQAAVHQRQQQQQQHSPAAAAAVSSSPVASASSPVAGSATQAVRASRSAAAAGLTP